MSDDVRKRMSEIRKGKRLSEEHKKRCSEGQRGVKKTGHGKIRQGKKYLLVEGDHPR